MKSKKRNEMLADALVHVKSAANLMADLDSDIHGDGVFKKTVGDELAFQEVGEMSGEVLESLLRIVPKIRLLQYIE